MKKQKNNATSDYLKRVQQERAKRFGHNQDGSRIEENKKPASTPAGANSRMEVKEGPAQDNSRMEIKKSPGQDGSPAGENSKKLQTKNKDQAVHEIIISENKHLKQLQKEVQKNNTKDNNKLVKKPESKKAEKTTGSSEPFKLNQENVEKMLRSKIGILAIIGAALMLLTYIVGVMLNFKYTKSNPLGLGSAYATALSNLTYALFFGITFAGIIFGIVYLIKENKRKSVMPETKMDLSENNPYGSAKKEMTEFEKEKYIEKVPEFKDTQNLVYGKEGTNYICRKEVRGLNGNMLICGGPGSGKSTSGFFNHIEVLSRLGKSMLISDVKGELYENTANMLRKRGYEVKVFNTEDIMASDSWNVLGAVSDKDELETLVNIMMESSIEKGQKKDFWYNSSYLMFRALCLYVKYNRQFVDDASRNIKTVMELVQYKSADELKAVFDKLLPNDEANVNFKAIENDRVSDVRSNLLSYLSDFNSKIVKEVCSVDDIDLSELGKKKCAYFLIKPASSNKYQYLSTLFVLSAFNILEKQAKRRPGKKLEIPVTFVLDEFAQLGEIPNFDKILATCRAAGMDVIMGIQDLPQLYTIYGEQMGSQIIGKCSTFLVMGVSAGDEVTKNFFSKMSGETTVETFSVNKSGGGFLTAPNISETVSEGKGYIFTPHQISQLNVTGKELLFINGSNTYELDKLFFLDDNPYFKNLVIDPPAQHIPHWVEEQFKRTDWKQEKIKRRGGIYRFFNDDLSDVPEMFVPILEEREKIGLESSGLSAEEAHITKQQQVKLNKLISQLKEKDYKTIQKVLKSTLYEKASEGGAEKTPNENSELNNLHTKTPDPQPDNNPEEAGIQTEIKEARIEDMNEKSMEKTKDAPIKEQADEVKEEDTKEKAKEKEVKEEPPKTKEIILNVNTASTKVEVVKDENGKTKIVKGDGGRIEDLL